MSLNPSHPPDAGLAPYDVLTMGRVGVDLYPLQSGVGLAEVETFQKFLGGSPTNVAVAAARMGRRAAVITRVGPDPFGDYVHRALRDLGVDDRHVRSVPGLLTPLAFCEIHPPDDFPLYFYREPIAPDLAIEADELDADAIASAKVFWVTLTGLSREPSRTAHHAALDIRGRATHTILDLDHRPTFWPDPAEATAQVRAVLPRVTVAIGNREECAVAVGETEPRAAAEALLDAGVDLAIVKQGPKGVLGMTADQAVEVPPHLVDVVNGLGAGDAFGGTFCHGLLAGWPLEDVLHHANVAGAIVASRLECSTAMPTPQEVEAVLDGHDLPARQERP